MAQPPRLAPVSSSGKPRTLPQPPARGELAHPQAQRPLIGLGLRQGRPGRSGAWPVGHYPTSSSAAVHVDGSTSRDAIGISVEDAAAMWLALRESPSSGMQTTIRRISASGCTWEAEAAAVGVASVEPEGDELVEVGLQVVGCDRALRLPAAWQTTGDEDKAAGRLRTSDARRT